MAVPEVFAGRFGGDLCAGRSEAWKRAIGAFRRVVVQKRRAALPAR
jgi:hypothetical protein